MLKDFSYSSSSLLSVMKILFELIFSVFPLSSPCLRSSCHLCYYPSIFFLFVNLFIFSTFIAILDFFNIPYFRNSVNFFSTHNAINSLKLQFLLLYLCAILYLCYIFFIYFIFMLQSHTYNCNNIKILHKRKLQ